MKDTSWEKASTWYDQLVGDTGHYYHSHVILPGLKALLPLKKGNSLLEIGCGQGVFAKSLPQGVLYTGVDLSPSLIKSAKSSARENQQFLVADVTAPLKIAEFSHTLAILCLQNMERPDLAIQNMGANLKKGGRGAIVLNHPCYRIPRQSSWDVDPGNNIQYRRINGYLSPQKIPIDTHPGRGQKKTTWSYHYPLSYWFAALKEAGLKVITLEEWCSDKKSVGAQAKRENRARLEFPLFLTLVFEKG